MPRFSHQYFALKLWSKYEFKRFVIQYMQVVKARRRQCLHQYLLFAFFFQNRIERANTICIFCRSKCFTHTSKMAKLKTKLTKLLNYINSRWSKWKIAMNKKQQLCALINGFVNAKNRWEQAHENLRRWFFHRVLPRLWSLASEWPFLSFSHNFSNFVRTAAPMHSHFTCSWFDQTFSFFFTI